MQIWIIRITMHILIYESHCFSICTIELLFNTSFSMPKLENGRQVKIYSFSEPNIPFLYQYFNFIKFFLPKYTCLFIGGASWTKVFAFVKLSSFLKLLMIKDVAYRCKRKSTWLNRSSLLDFKTRPYSRPHARNMVLF